MLLLIKYRLLTHVSNCHLCSKMRSWANPYAQDCKYIICPIVRTLEVFSLLHRVESRKINLALSQIELMRCSTLRVLLQHWYRLYKALKSIIGSLWMIPYLPRSFIFLCTQLNLHPRLCMRLLKCFTLNTVSSKKSKVKLDQVSIKNKDKTLVL